MSSPAAAMSSPAAAMSSPAAAAVPADAEYFMKVDWRETSRGHYFAVEVSGINGSGLAVYINDAAPATLKITGKRDSTVFTRQFSLPEGAITQDTEASVKDGLLTVIVPKRVFISSIDGDAHRLEVSVTPSALIYKLDTPGLEKQDVKVDLHNVQAAADDDGPPLKRLKSQHLVVKGEWNTCRPETVIWHCRERSSGSFIHHISLPSGIGTKTDDLVYQINDGLLSVTVPKDPAVTISDDEVSIPPPVYRDADPAAGDEHLSMRTIHIK